MLNQMTTQKQVGSSIYRISRSVANCLFLLFLCLVSVTSKAQSQLVSQKIDSTESIKGQALESLDSFSRQDIVPVNSFTKPELPNDTFLTVIDSMLPSLKDFSMAQINGLNQRPEIPILIVFNVFSMK